MKPNHYRPDLGWILDELVAAPHARHAVVLSADGLAVVASDGVHKDLADRISATSAGLQALSRNGAVFVRDQGTAWQQTMVQYEDGFLFVIAAGHGSHLVAAATAEVDVLGFSYRMADTVKRLGPELAVAPRHSAGQG
ncbi:roadblock/LC7 domain-containing protein [Streptomyces sp. NPDC059627]